jgi:uncharacterized protein with NRDE domain
MCIILFSYNTHPKYKLIMASNRDEFYDRPTEQLAQWPDNENIIAGRDKQDGGTWMGVTKDGKFSALTNYRDLSRIKDNAPSRGFLVSDFLQTNESPEEYLKKIKKKASQYNDFNLLVGENDDLFYFSNVNNKLIKVEPGIHGLSNRFLDTPWPKVEKGKMELEKHIQNDNIDTELIMNLLSNTSTPPDNELPDTGVGLEWERALSPIFIKTPKYGTRASSLLTIDYRGNISFIEKSYIKTTDDEFSTKTKRINS